MGSMARTLAELDKFLATPAPSAPLKLAVAPIVEDYPQLDRLRVKFEKASTRTGMPVEILAAIASRESRVGKQLDRTGHDPKKESYGIMQIAGRYHKQRGTNAPDSQAHINQAAEILAKNKKLIDDDKRFAKWSDAQRMQGAVAAYNMGFGNVRTWKNLDVGTTGGDYSKDVMSRAEAYKFRGLEAQK